MVNFDNTNRAIYLQIADAICDKIMSGKLRADERVASVREYASEVAVNVNTVMRAYEFLESQDIIYNKRGLGFFVSEGAYEIIHKQQSEELFENELPELFKKLSLMGVTPETLKNRYEEYLRSVSKG